jgi:hypothetical protein
MITRRAAEDRYNGTNGLASILRVTKQTIQTWAMDEPIPATHQKTLAGWIDRDFWKDTFAEIAEYYPVFAGDSDDRLRRRLFDNRRMCA